MLKIEVFHELITVRDTNKLVTELIVGYDDELEEALDTITDLLDYLEVEYSIDSSYLQSLNR